MSISFRRSAAALICSVCAFAMGCGERTGFLRASGEEEPCPESLRDHVLLSVAALPVAVPTEFTATNDAVPRYGVQARRILVSVRPTEPNLPFRVISSSLSIAILGGTFRGLGAAAGNHGGGNAGVQGRNIPVPWRVVSDRQAIDASPGEIRIAPFLEGHALHAQTESLDVVITAGGMPVDVPVVVTSQLWGDDIQAAPADRLHLELQPVRLPSVYDVVDVAIEFNYSVALPQSSGKLGSCAVEAKQTVIDRDAVRPALWDIGVPINGGLRMKWLALYDPNSGPTRAVFTSPVAASAFAKWARRAGATRVGKYQLGLFTPDAPNKNGPVVPADRSLMDTFQPVSNDDLEHFTVGPIDKP